METKELQHGLTTQERNLNTGSVAYGLPMLGSSYAAVGWAATTVQGGEAEVALYFHQRVVDGAPYLFDIEMTAVQARAMAQLLLHTAAIAEALQTKAATAWNGAPEGVVLQ